MIKLITYTPIDAIKSETENYKSLLSVSFDCTISTKALLELTRHRIDVSMTVTSTRYALKKLLRNETKFEYNQDGIKRSSKYLELTGDAIIDKIEVEHLEKIRDLVIWNQIKNDKLALMLPQMWKYDLMLTMGYDALVAFLKLRLHKSAHKNIRDMANDILGVLPKEYVELVKLDLGLK